MDGYYWSVGIDYAKHSKRTVFARLDFFLADLTDYINQEEMLLRNVH